MAVWRRDRMDSQIGRKPPESEEPSGRRTSDDVARMGRAHCHHSAEFCQRLTSESICALEDLFDQAVPLKAFDQTARDTARYQLLNRCNAVMSFEMGQSPCGE